MSKVVQSAMESLHPDYSTDVSNIPFPATLPKSDAAHAMWAARWYGDRDIHVEQVPKPLITEPKDAIIRITTTTVCGSDLHLYHNEFSGLQEGDILGHEGVGIVEDVGSECQSLKPGDRVVISFCIACGECMYCKKGQYSLCDCTNPSEDMNKMYGARLSGIFGYTHLLGGYPGLQAEYARVPIADVNCLKLPSEIPNDSALLLSDIACTAWHANELCNVEKDDIVAVWGMGPVGMLACMWALHRGAQRVIGIDHVQYRLDKVEKHLNIETINFETDGDPVKMLQEKVPHGPNKCIDASGFRFSKSMVHKVERALRLETDMAQSFNECVLSCRKGGSISLIADYYGYANHVNLGALMEKQVMVHGGQCFVQKYWKQILDKIMNQEVDPTFVITHHMPFKDVDKAYAKFDNYEDEAVKIILSTEQKEEEK